MKAKTSPIVSNITGSIGGVAFSKTRSGLAVRAKRKRFQPAGSRQKEQNGTMTKAVRTWKEVLSADNRQAWNEFAKTQSFADPLGQAKQISGYNLWLKHFLTFNNPKVFPTNSILYLNPPVSSSLTPSLTAISYVGTGASPFLIFSANVLNAGFINISASFAYSFGHRSANPPRTFPYALDRNLSSQPRGAVILFVPFGFSSVIGDYTLWYRYSLRNPQGLANFDNQGSLKFSIT